MADKGPTFSSFVSATPMVTLDKLIRSENYRPRANFVNYGLLVIVVRIIFLPSTQVLTKKNILNGEKLMLNDNLLMPRLYIILGPIKLVTLSGIR